MGHWMFMYVLIWILSESLGAAANSLYGYSEGNCCPLKINCKCNDDDLSMGTIHADWMAYNRLYSFQNTSFSTGLLALPAEYNMDIKFFFFLMMTTLSVEAVCAYYKIVISSNN